MKTSFFKSTVIVTAFTIAAVSGFIAGCSTDKDPIPVQDYNTSKITLIDAFEGADFVVFASGKYGLMQAYNRELDGTLLDLELLPGRFPVIMKDNEGSEWNIFGIAVSGPATGRKLKIMNTMMGYYFSFAAMFPEVTIYGEEEKDAISIDSPDDDWLIDPSKLIFGSFKDGIPSLDLPELELFNTSFKNEIYIKDEELVVVYHDGDVIRVFPHKILDWHEVINDESGLGNTVLSYCPLTGTASLWSSQVAGENLSFGVSGLLYNSNLILYDRLTESNWSQMLQQAVHGDLIETIPEVLPYLEMTWAAARKLDDQLKVLSENTGFGRDYDQYPYGDYRTNNDFISYPLNFRDDRIPNKERVMAVIINGRAKVYRFSHFE